VFGVIGRSDLSTAETCRLRVYERVGYWTI